MKKAGAILAAIATPDLSDFEVSASFDELTRLCETLGYSVLGRASQKKENYKSPSVFGVGKLQEVARTIFDSREAVSALIFDRELSPLQGRNVEKIVNTEISRLQSEFIDSTSDDHPNVAIQVYDRTAVIIEIFFKHAKSRQSKLQIEIAKLKYGSPRMREELERNGDRQGGGIGGKGAGETKSEIKGRELRDRLAAVRAELEAVQQENESRRVRRETQSVALVGYTNSGKSSLMRSLTKSDVLAEDRLFATLDVTTRQLQPPAAPPIVVTDTIGFVRFLPHDLLASFKSTLAEANQADLLLHVVDSSDVQFREHIKTTSGVLGELEIDLNRQQMVFNKMDRIDNARLSQLRDEFPDAWFMSALDPANVKVVREHLLAFFGKKQTYIHALVPFDEGNILGEIRKIATVVKETYTAEGAEIEMQIKPLDLSRLRSRHPHLDFREQS